MEQTNHIKAVLATYYAAIDAVKSAKSVREVDDAKLAGTRAYNELSRQLSRSKPEFPRLCRERRAELTLAHYEEITNRTVITKAPETLEDIADPVVIKKPAKKAAKKAKK